MLITFLIELYFHLISFLYPAFPLSNVLCTVLTNTFCSATLVYVTALYSVFLVVVCVFKNPSRQLFFLLAIIIWNNLPAHVIGSNNIDEFKSSLSNNLYVARYNFVIYVFRNFTHLCVIVFKVIHSTNNNNNCAG